MIWGVKAPIFGDQAWVQELFLSMDHPRVARLLDVYESEGRLSLVMECMEGGRMVEALGESSKGPMVCSEILPGRKIKWWWP